MGGQLRPEMAIAHFKRIAAATDLPLIVFQYPMHRARLSVRDASYAVRGSAVDRRHQGLVERRLLHERHTRTFQSLPRPVTVLTTHSAWLMASLTMGCGGLLSGAGSVIPELQVALFRGGPGRGSGEGAGHQRPDLPARAGLLLAALPRHAQPHEGGLVMLGRLDKAVVRPPLMKLKRHRNRPHRRRSERSRNYRRGRDADRVLKEWTPPPWRMSEFRVRCSARAGSARWNLQTGS